MAEIDRAIGVHEATLKSINKRLAKIEYALEQLVAESHQRKGMIRMAYLGSAVISFICGIFGAKI